MSRPELDEISRRLVDLAESGGPWDDPLPEVRRRAAELSGAELGTGSPSAGSSVFRAPTAVRRSRGWLHSLDGTLVVAAAVVVALVAGVGWLIHSGGPSSDTKSAASSLQASSAAGAASNPAATSAAAGQPIPRTAAVACGWPAPTSAVTVRAPARVHIGATVSVRVRLTGRAAADVYNPLVVAVQNGRVVGRLVPTLIPPGPRQRPSSPTSVSTDLSGTLRRSTCAQATAQAHGPQVPRGLALPPGRYQLIAVATAGAAGSTTAVSAPVTVTVIR